jgi:hypothetical protein
MQREAVKRKKSIGEWVAELKSGKPISLEPAFSRTFLEYLREFEKEMLPFVDVKLIEGKARLVVLESYFINEDES